MRQIKIILFFAAVVFCANRFAFAEEVEGLQRSRQAVERLLTNEQNPDKRIQLALRWIILTQKLDREMALNPAASANVSTDESSTQLVENTDEKIIRKVNEQLSLFENKSQKRLNPLYQQSAFASLRLKRYDAAISAFQAMQNRNEEDEMGFGDALLSAGLVTVAVEAYGKATKAHGIQGLALYKQAWAYIQLHEFGKALQNFDEVIALNKDRALQEKAYNDRLLPFVEVFKKPTFSQDDAVALKTMASGIYPVEPERVEALFKSALETLIQSFFSKGDIEKAHSVYGILKSRSETPDLVALQYSPLWLKNARKQLDHKTLQQTAADLPEKLPAGSAGFDELKNELLATLAFYEKLLSDGEKTYAKAALPVFYEKYLKLFPESLAENSVAHRYAKVLLVEQKPTECLSVLGENAGEASPAVPAPVKATLAQCELKKLDELYRDGPRESFEKHLHAALVEKKIYQRTDLGIGSYEAFELLSRMLLGALQKNSSSETLTAMLNQVVSEFAYDKSSKLYADLQTLSSELKFQNAESSSASYFQIAAESPKASSVRQKAYENGIVLAGNDAERHSETLAACDQYKSEYASVFVTEAPVFQACVATAESAFDVDREYAYWKQNEKKLKSDEMLRLGSLELALGIESAKSRLSKIPEGRRVLELWQTASVKSKSAVDKKFEQLENEQKKFLSALKPIQVAQIEKIVPQKMKQFENVDSAWIRYGQDVSGPSAARSMESRAVLSAMMLQWLSSLPAPTLSTEDEKAEYRKQTDAFLKPWMELAALREKECGENAYVVDVSFRPQSAGVCREAVSEAQMESHLRAWRDSVEDARKSSDAHGRNYLEAAVKEKRPQVSRYFLLRALDLVVGKQEKAQVYEMLAQITGDESYWLAAEQLDPSRDAVLRHGLERVKGNPFYERLYARKIENLRPSAVISVDQSSSDSSENQ